MIFNYSITRCKNDLTGMLHGTTLNQVTNLYGIFNRAASQLLLDCDPQETKRIFPIANGVYNAVYEYEAPVDVKGNRILSLFPQVQQWKWNNNFTQQYQQNFNFSKFWGPASTFNILFNSGVKTMQINWSNARTSVIVNEADEIEDNGVWDVGGTASNLQNDNINYVSGNGSLSFNLASGTDPSHGYLENTTSQPVNLSAIVNQSVLFIYTYMPAAIDFESVELRWGSSPNDYYVQTATVTQQNTAFQDGWNLLAFPWVSASTVGTPDPSNLTYLRVTWNYDGVQQTAVRLDNVVSNLASILNCAYYSKYLFSNPNTGAWQETVLTDNDRVNLDTDAYTLFLYLCAAFCAQQQSGNESGFDSSYFLNLYNRNLKTYTTKYKSEVIKPQVVYYKQPGMQNLRRFFRNR